MYSTTSGMVINNFNKPVTYSVKCLQLKLKQQLEINQMETSTQSIEGKKKSEVKNKQKNQAKYKYYTEYITRVVQVSPGQFSQQRLIDTGKEDVFSLWIGTIDQKQQILIDSCKINNQFNNIRIQINEKGNLITVPLYVYNYETKIKKDIRKAMLCQKQHTLQLKSVQRHEKYLQHNQSSNIILEKQSLKCTRCCSQIQIKKWKNCLYDIYNSRFCTIVLLIFTFGLYYFCSCYSNKKKPNIQIYTCQCREAICEQCYNKK